MTNQSKIPYYLIWNSKYYNFHRAQWGNRKTKIPFYMLKGIKSQLPLEIQAECEIVPVFQMKVEFYHKKIPFQQFDMADPAIELELSTNYYEFNNLIENLKLEPRFTHFLKFDRRQVLTTNKIISYLDSSKSFYKQTDDFILLGDKDSIVYIKMSMDLESHNIRIYESKSVLSSIAKFKKSLKESKEEMKEALKKVPKIL